MIDFNYFYKQIAVSSLSNWLEVLPNQIKQWKKNTKCHQFKNWQKIVQNLPCITPSNLDLKTGVIAKNMNNQFIKKKQWIIQLLKKLTPWRKGPFDIYDINIDCEWRSDWKWNRISPHISPLMNKKVLDVGCGNGYFMWRMIGEGAKIVIGIDPSQLFLHQFEAIRKLIGNNQKLHLLPLKIEQLPKLSAFDTVFSMGVLYHCRSPLDHICQLKNQLISGGELVLESLVILGNESQCLIPHNSYAKMRNIYFIPSAEMIKLWLEKCGFYDVCIIDQTVTTIQEQRKTTWMEGESLENFLNPNNINFTIEGYPAPLRAVLIAKNK
ncbi:tRNA (mo5U34)-methyltransferase [Candidatus Arsenophonus lipoptenae]|uniref:tRNA U34 carboxymethyltransferase n=1 Tax=Candidatus Arsenophonus lipoptenae TaxID=634113 RepID=A0A0X9VF20_9GAMM|nr:tRNA 5-methoxyuridine(34)/uridine 5-oxyacetic acid(34) synthase CmoB [Candidatus Arsenophonus lipoptenae]AMA65199.1 tRNA (mo5U34)-methyltransferase [Candidatus Arsenophonus lipoptenae]